MMKMVTSQVIIAYDIQHIKYLYQRKRKRPNRKERSTTTMIDENTSLIFGTIIMSRNDDDHGWKKKKGYTPLMVFDALLLGYAFYPGQILANNNNEQKRKETHGWDSVSQIVVE